MVTRRNTRRGPTHAREWQPLRRATPFRTAAKKAALVEMGVDPEIDLDGELWMSNKYIVAVRRTEEEPYHVVELSIRRTDRGYARDWRDFQRIKNQLAGPEAEAIELFPAQSRLYDTANQYWLWCFPPGEMVQVGFAAEDMVVSGAEAAERMGARQREIPDGYLEPEIFTINMNDIRNCPMHSLLVTHYFHDGTCKCVESEVR